MRTSDNYPHNDSIAETCIAHWCKSFLTASALSSALFSIDLLLSDPAVDVRDPDAADVVLLDFPASVVGDLEADLGCDCGADPTGLRHLEHRDTVMVSVLWLSLPDTAPDCMAEDDLVCSAAVESCGLFECTEPAVDALEFLPLATSEHKLFLLDCLSDPGGDDVFAGGGEVSILFRALSLGDGE